MQAESLDNLPPKTIVYGPSDFATGDIVRVKDTQGVWVVSSYVTRGQSMKDVSATTFWLFNERDNRDRIWAHWSALTKVIKLDG